MQKDYNKIIQERAQHVFDVMTQRISAEDMNRIRAAFYNDDIQVFTPKGKKIILPQNSTVIDFAY